ATGVAADEPITFTIANRQTSVSTGTIQLFVNNSNVTSGFTLSNNTAGTVVTYQTPVLFTNNATQTVRAIFSDGSVSQTNTWTFNTANLAVLPTAFALTSGSG